MHSTFITIDRRATETEYILLPELFIFQPTPAQMQFYPPKCTFPDANIKILKNSALDLKELRPHSPCS